MKRISKKWMEKYFGIDLSYLKGRKGRIVQLDGGKATWDFDVPTNPKAERIFQSSSKTYFFIPN